MKSFARLLTCLLTGMVIAAVHPVMASENSTEPRISLTVANQPLGEVLDSITGDTGYRFNLNDRWEDYPVSATIRNLPLEQGLKRLLRSLNHTIIWESDKVVTIKVYGKAEPDNTGPGISFAAPPQEVPEVPEPAAEIEPPAAETSAPTDAGESAPAAQADAQAESSQEQRETDTSATQPNQEPKRE